MPWTLNTTFFKDCIQPTQVYVTRQTAMRVRKQLECLLNPNYCSYIQEHLWELGTWIQDVFHEYMGGGVTVYFSRLPITLQNHIMQLDERKLDNFRRAKSERLHKEKQEREKKLTRSRRMSPPYKVLQLDGCRYRCLGVFKSLEEARDFAQEHQPSKVRIAYIDYVKPMVPDDEYSLHLYVYKYTHFDRTKGVYYARVRYSCWDKQGRGHHCFHNIHFEWNPLTGLTIPGIRTSQDEFTELDQCQKDKLEFYAKTNFEVCRRAKQHKSEFEHAL